MGRMCAANPSRLEAELDEAAENCGHVCMRELERQAASALAWQLFLHPAAPKKIEEEVQLSLHSAESFQWLAYAGFACRRWSAS